MSDIAIRVKNVTKAYQIYDKPQDRLKQSLWRGLKKFYREFKALDDVSFEVKKGETVGIIGSVATWLGFAWFQKTRRGFADVL